MSDQQRHLFDTEPAPWQEDDQAEQLVATLVLPTGPAQQFDYLVPDGLRDQIEPGRRVRVPLGRGNRLVTGYCVRLESRVAGPRRLKFIEEVLDRRSLLSPAMLRLTEWIAQRYLCDWGQVLETVLPAGVRGQAGTRMTTLLSLAADAGEKMAAMKLPEKQQAVLAALSAAKEPLTSQRVGPAGALHAGPHYGFAPQGAHSCPHRAGVQRRPQGERAAERREANLTPNPDQAKALAAILAALRASSTRSFSSTA